jgi:hypothetical protein
MNEKSNPRSTEHSGWSSAARGNFITRAAQAIRSMRDESIGSAMN